jgi:hypothetical protein
MSRLVADEISKSNNPYPYIDALIFQITQNVGVVTVRHDERPSGESGYTLRALLRLWMSMLINASVMPLRIATLAGIAISALGFFSFIGVLINHYIKDEPLGWASLMAGAAHLLRHAAAAARHCGRIHRPHLPARVRETAKRGALSHLKRRWRWREHARRHALILRLAKRAGGEVLRRLRSASMSRPRTCAFTVLTARNAPSSFHASTAAALRLSQ